MMREWGRFYRASHLVKAFFNEWLLVTQYHRTWRLVCVRACLFKVEVVDKRMLRSCLNAWIEETGKRNIQAFIVVDKFNEGISSHRIENELEGSNIVITDKNQHQKATMNDIHLVNFQDRIKDGDIFVDHWQHNVGLAATELEDYKGFMKHLLHQWSFQTMKTALKRSKDHQALLFWEYHLKHSSFTAMKK